MVTISGSATEKCERIGVAPFYKAYDLVLDRVEARILAVVACHGHDIQVIERGKVIEVNDVIVEIL
jgi:hypothetical protein